MISGRPSWLNGLTIVYFNDAYWFVSFDGENWYRSTTTNDYLPIGLTYEVFDGGAAPAPTVSEGACPDISSSSSQSTASSESTAL